MNLFKESASFFAWSANVLGVFFKVRPATTLAVLVLSVVSLVTNILIIVVPIRVIGLAYSPEVPSYFRFFLGPDQHLAAMIILSSFAVLCFVLDLVIPPITGRLSAPVASDVMQDANQIAIMNNQVGELQSHYEKLTQSLAGLGFSVLSLAFLFLVNPLLSASIPAQMALFFLVAAAALSGFRGRATPLATYLRGRSTDFVKLASSIIFIVCFAIVLYPLVTGQGGNIAVVFISFIVMRRLLSVLSSMTRNWLKIAKNRDLISALVFSDHQLLRGEKNDVRELQEVFPHDRQAEIIRNALGDTEFANAKLDVEWTDCAVGFMSTFSVRAQLPGTGTVRHLQWQILPDRMSHLFDNEDFLFSFMSRTELLAPEVVANFFEGAFRCRIVSTDAAEPMSNGQWQQQWPLIRNRIYGVAPPSGLVDAYFKSHPSLDARFNRQLLENLFIATNGSDRRGLTRLLGRLASIQDMLHRMPVVLENPLLNPFVVMSGPEETAIVPTWTRWELEPLGSRLPPNADLQHASALLKVLRETRDDIDERMDPETVLLVRDCALLENHIARGQYRAGLAVALVIADEDRLQSASVIAAE